jgi:iron(III) transport system permease protein
MMSASANEALRPLPASRAVRLERNLWQAPWMQAAAGLVSLLALVPVGFIVWVAWQTGWDISASLVFRPRVGELLWNTSVLLLFAVPASMVLAVALAWLTERSDLPGGRIWAWLCVAPLAVPAFVHSYSWVTLIPGFEGPFAAVLISVLAYFPFLYLPVAAMLRRLDPALEDAAASLGFTPRRVFLRVVLPQLRLALCGGALLVGLHLLAEYGLYVFVRYDTFTTAIVDQFQSTFNGPAAVMLAGVLVACCLGLLAIEAAVRGHGRYARVGSGAPRNVVRTRLGGLKIPCLLLMALTAALSLGVPVLTIGRRLMVGGVTVWRMDAIGLALAQTVVLAVLGGLLTTAMAVPMGWLSNRAPGKLQRVLEGTNYVVGSLPGVVVALALVTITVRVALPLYQTMTTILLAYALMFLPRSLVSLRASIAQAPVEREHAAASLGRSPVRALWATTIRLAAPGAAAGMAMASLGIMNELPATQMLAPNGTRTLAMGFWALSGELDYAAAAPYALVMVLISLPFTWLLHAQSKRMAGR